MSENVVENVVEEYSEFITKYLNGYGTKKRQTAKILLNIIKNDSQITIAKMAAASGTSTRTVQRYLQDFQNAGILKREGGDINGE